MKKLLFLSGALLVLITGIILSCRKDLQVDSNQPPVANAGNDVTIILPLDSVKLDGRASKDPDGSIKEFLWSKISGPSSYAFSAPQSATATIRDLVHGIYQIELKVTDDEGLATRDTVLVMVDTAVIANHPPIAKAGNDTAILLPVDSVILDGSASFDAEGPISAYLWSKISGPSSFQFTDQGSPITIIKNLTKGTYQLELKVTDQHNLTASDTIVIIVDAINTSNRPPVANAGPDQAFRAEPEFLFFDGVSSEIDGTQSADPDSNIVSYRWSQIGGAPAVISNSDSAKSSVTIYQYDSYQFELKVTDSQGLSDMDTILMTVTVTDTANRPPFANAGTDQVIYLPDNSITLDGSGSTDPNNNITAFQWTKFSGPPSFNIANSNAAQTVVTALTEGTYLFELKVTDATALTSTDYIQVRVIACGAPGRTLITPTLIPVNNAPQVGYVAAAAVANKIVFAGDGSTKVNIYDIVSNTWTTAQLSEARHSITAIAAGSKIFFAGGQDGVLGDLQMSYSAVDIYDASTNTWSVTSLSSPAYGMAAVFAGNKVFFAGGIRETGATNIVDVYDLSTNSWSTLQLSEAKTDISAVTLNNKIYFAGGYLYGSSAYSNKIEIYDLASNSWSSSTLSEGKVIGGGGVAAGNKIYWAGGFSGSEASCKVEIKDLTTQNISFEYLSKPGVAKSIISNNKIVFFSFNRFDVYDINSKTWSAGVLPDVFVSIISAGNEIYLSGSSNNPGQLWKLEF